MLDNMDNMTFDELAKATDEARAAYDAYGHHVAEKAMNGVPVPHLLAEKYAHSRKAWFDCVEALTNYVLKGERNEQ